MSYAILNYCISSETECGAYYLYLDERHLVILKLYLIAVLGNRNFWTKSFVLLKPITVLLVRFCHILKFVLLIHQLYIMSFSSFH